MKKKKTAWNTVALLGGLAAAGAALWLRREQLRSVLSDAAKRLQGEEPEYDVPDVPEKDIVIDATGKQADALFAGEETPEG